jgi:hypothetical protein
LEPIVSPPATASKVDLTVVQSMFAVRPEVNRIGTHAKSSPAQWARDFAVLEFFGERRMPREKISA